MILSAAEAYKYVYAVDAQGQGPSRVKSEWRAARLFRFIQVYPCHKNRAANV